MIHDFYSDSERAVLKELLATEGPDAFPDCVKQASTLVPSEEFRTEKTAFAFPHRNLYPIDSPADVWLSAQYFKKTAHLVPVQYRQMVADSIKQAAEAFGVDTTLPSERQVKQASAPVPVAESLYGVKQASEEGFSMVIENAQQLKAANASFPNGLEHLSPLNLHQVAATLYKFAKEEGIAPSRAVEELAYPIKRSSLVDQMQARYAHCVESNRRAKVVASYAEKSASYQGRPIPTYAPEVVEGYHLLVEKAATIAPDHLGDLVSFCRELDEISGLDKVGGLLSAERMNRTFIDDMAPTRIKLAGYPVSLEAIRGLDALQDLAPEAYDADTPVKLAHALQQLPEMRQKALLVIVRGR